MHRHPIPKQNENYKLKLISFRFSSLLLVSEAFFLP